ncbi:Thyroid hormone receptor-associated protein 3 [Manis javanica]|nr:Thyroid hormone receptor-associated protein 3 [Manis javanica]
MQQSGVGIATVLTPAVGTKVLPVAYVAVKACAEQAPTKSSGPDQAWEFALGQESFYCFWMVQREGMKGISPLSHLHLMKYYVSFKIQFEWKLGKFRSPFLSLQYFSPNLDQPLDKYIDDHNGEYFRKRKERDLKRGKSKESVDSRDSSHSRERSAEKTEKTHKGSKKQKKHRRARDRSRSSSSSSPSSCSCKAEEYTEEAEGREESTTGFDKSRLGTKDFVGPSERGGRARRTFQYRARGRGWGRGGYSANSSSNDFQKKNQDEEWDPEYTPKSKKYYLHDDREGEGSEKWMSRAWGRGAFPWGRG